ncbi:hypothetical protein GCM10007880_57670 [Mesorhizobium amorphae]|nr:hypothetical protein GCM10007880_57670 [Mesorhizobium amorphae]
MKKTLPNGTVDHSRSFLFLVISFVPDARGKGGPFRRSAHALERDRPDILKRRRAWFDGQLDLDPAKLVLVDKTGLSTKMARLRGRALRGERCRAGVPHGQWKTFNRRVTADGDDRSVRLRQRRERQCVPRLPSEGRRSYVGGFNRRIPYICVIIMHGCQIKVAAAKLSRCFKRIIWFGTVDAPLFASA